MLVLKNDDMKRIVFCHNRSVPAAGRGGRGEQTVEGGAIGKLPQPVKCFLVVFLKQPAQSDERPVVDQR